MYDLYSVLLALGICFDADPEPDPDPAQNIDADPDPDPDPGGGGSSAKNVHPPWQNPRYAPAYYRQAKIVSKTLIPTVL